MISKVASRRMACITALSLPALINRLYLHFVFWFDFEKVVSKVV